MAFSAFVSAAPATPERAADNIAVVEARSPSALALSSVLNDLKGTVQTACQPLCKSTYFIIYAQFSDEVIDALDHDTVTVEYIGEITGKIQSAFKETLDQCTSDGVYFDGVLGLGTIFYLCAEIINVCPLLSPR